MSGVYIKGMEMPHNCVGCKLWYLIPLADTMEDICRVTGHRVNPYHRADDCPLIAVPDHGRLIDADALMENARFKGTYDTVNAWDIANAPTIIPAEEGEK